MKIGQRNALHLSCCVSRDQILTRLVRLEWCSSGLQWRIEEPQLTSRFPFQFTGSKTARGLPRNQKWTPLYFSVFLCICLSQAHTQNAMRSFGMGHLYWIGIEGLEILSGLQNSTHSMATMIMTLRHSRNAERKKGEGFGVCRGTNHVLFKD